MSNGFYVAGGCRRNRLIHAGISLLGSLLLASCSKNEADANAVKPPKPVPDTTTPGTGVEGSVQTAPVDPRNPDDLPADPSLGIAKLQAAYSGAKLGSKLYSAGRYYSSLGADQVKSFILEVPPGSIGQQALAGAMHGIAPELAPEMFAFLGEQTSVLGATLVKNARQDLLDAWGGRDFEKAWAFVGAQGAGKEEVSEWFSELAASGPREEVIAAVKSIQDPVIRDRVIGSQGYIYAQIDGGNFEIFTELGERMKEAEVSHLLLQALDRSTAPPSDVALNALMKSGVPEARPLVSKAISNWLARDTNAALVFLDSTSDPVLENDVILKSWKTIAENDPEAAKLWAQKIIDPDQREKVMESLNH